MNPRHWTPAAIECQARNADCKRCFYHLTYGLERDTSCFMPDTVAILKEKGIPVPEDTSRLKLIPCQQCGETFYASKETNLYCGKSCARKARWQQEKAQKASKSGIPGE